MTTKLEIIGPYTPDHDGPFCTNDGLPVEIIFRDGRGDYPIMGYIGDSSSLENWSIHGFFYKGKSNKKDLMNAREVRVPREVWVNEYTTGDSFPRHTKEDAEKSILRCKEFIRTIHFREVVEGE